jgi:diguanylate cyclase (GGDEF)-like protein/PAS domain S-box-containing protein
MTSITHAPPGANDVAVRAELARALFGSIVVPLMNTVIAVISVVVLWPIYPAWIILTWLGASAAVAVFRLALWLRFQRRQHDAGTLGAWAFAFTLASATMGCLWGLLASTVFVTPDLVYTVFVAFVLGGVSAAAATHNSPHLPAYYGFMLPAALPIIVALLTRGAAMPIAMGLMVMAFLAVITVVARDNNRRLVEYIRMKIEQGALNNDLQKLTFDLTREVGERRQIAAELEESGERFRAIGQHALDAIIISGPDGEVVYWNAAAESTFGYTADEMAGRSILKILAPERYREQVLERYVHFVTTGEGDVPGKTVSLAALRKDGTEFPIELSVSAMNLGGIRHALGIARDVTERVKAAAALSEREAELREAQRVAHVGSWAYDPQTGTTQWSDELYRIFGRDTGPPAPTSAEYAKLLTPESFTLMTEALQKCTEREEPFGIDLELSRPDGQTGWVSMRGEVRRTANGQVRLGGTIQDISARRHAEQVARDGEAMFRSLVEQNTSGIFIVAEDGTIVYLNPRGLTMLGFSDTNSAIGQPLRDFVVDADQAAVAAAMQALIDRKRDFAEVVLKLRRANDGALAVLAQAVYGTFREKHVIITAVVDITERQRAENEIAKLNEQLAATVVVLRRREHDQTEIAKLSDLLQACATTSEVYPIVAATAESLFPQASGALARAEKGTHDLTRVAAWGADQVTEADFLIEDCWALRTGQRREVKGPGSAAQCRHFSRTPHGPYICMPLIVQGQTSGLLHFSLGEGGVVDDELRQTMQSFGDVVKLSLVNIEQLELLGQQAIRDHLTGLFNRRYLVETLPREVRRAQRSGSPLTIAMLDIDFFKKFNDEYSHDAGDKVLSELGLVLKQGLRAEDIACRYGGEEFVIVLPECDLATARARLLQICLVVRGKAPVFRGRTLPNITLSVGMATLSGALPTAESLITAADNAMYMAKSKGRDRIEDYRTPEAPERAPVTEAPASKTA